MTMISLRDMLIRCRCKCRISCPCSPTFTINTALYNPTLLHYSRHCGWISRPRDLRRLACHSYLSNFTKSRPVKLPKQGNKHKRKSIVEVSFSSVLGGGIELGTRSSIAFLGKWNGPGCEHCTAYFSTSPCSRSQPLLYMKGTKFSKAVNISFQSLSSF